MNFDKSSHFEGVTAPSLSSILVLGFCLFLELAMFIMFYSTYTETIGLMEDTYLSELPVIGGMFSVLDSDANASHIISLLLATFSVATPIFIWSEVFRQNILDDPQDWFSHPQNQIISGIAVCVLLLVCGLEAVSLYTLIIRETMETSGFIETQESGLMGYLAQNKGMAIGVSGVIAIVNLILALFSVRAARSLKSSQES